MTMTMVVVRLTGLPPLAAYVLTDPGTLPNHSTAVSENFREREKWG
jgi:hypothetical protein